MKKYLMLNMHCVIAISLVCVLALELPASAKAAERAFLAPSGTGILGVTAAVMGTNDNPTSTPVASDLLSQTAVITATPDLTLAYSVTPTITQTQVIYLPSVYKQPSPTDQVLYCDSIGSPIDIPNNNDAGLSNDIHINDNRFLLSTRIYLDISHSYVGDLVVKLSHQDTGQAITVLNRPGDTQNYCSQNDILAILDDRAARYADNVCASSPEAISGIYLPTESFSLFSGTSISGTWELNVSDHHPDDTGTLDHWCIQATLSDSLLPPTPPPPPVNLPSSASVDGMWGEDQQLTLDCESRAAVDWARHFGFDLDEIGFLNHLPRSDDPEIGFVGDPYGKWGSIPPNDYGVHAPPVAALLRDYGLTARAYHSLKWDDLRAEIAAGNPAIVWIIGDSYKNLVNGLPFFYTAASTGNTSVVAPHEHAVILVGYSASEVTILNGSRFMTVPLNQFLDSWSALDFMAVLARP